MRTMKHWAIAAMTATALALAGCGGGGSSTSTGPTTPTDDDPPPKSALSYATDLNGSVNALTTLAAAETVDGSALMMAMKYAGMIGTETSDGNSMAAMNNAAMVLKARSDLEAAIIAAEADKMEAEAAKAKTEDADVIEALDDAISKAEDEIEAAEDILNGDDLTGYVEMVTGDDEDDVKTAADRGEEVAMAVAMALGPTSSTDGTGTRVTFSTTSPPTLPVDKRAAANPVAMANKLDTDNHLGMTWEEIVGTDNVMSERVGASNTSRKVASVTGMTATDLNTVLTATGGTNSDGKYADGSTTATSNYKGIAGDVFCLGTDCEVNADGKLVGSWYFSPTDEDAHHEKVGGATDYTVELYVNYGHWLVVDDGSTTAADAGQANIVTYAALSGASPGTGLWDAASPAATDAGLRASSAEYSGTAVGRSVHKTLDGDGDITDIQSGRFMANVLLTATFAGAGSTLGGMIDGFQGVDNAYAVDPDWEVTLNAITTSDGSVTAGVTEATGQDGDWTSTAYGATTARPVGIFGSFNAHFTDGHAAGAYATRKD